MNLRSMLALSPDTAIFRFGVLVVGMRIRALRGTAGCVEVLCLPDRLLVFGFLDLPAMKMIG